MLASSLANYYLGVDGGQSSTTALIGDPDGRIIGMGRGGPCNHVGAAEGRAKFVQAIQGCVDVACTQAALDPLSVSFASACLGFSGGPLDKKAILHEILPARQILVTHDALIALSGATAGEPGVVVIAGTGSIAFGRNADGQTARAGGWGYLFGDGGGAFDLTRQAVRSILRFEEGWGPETILTKMLLEATGCPDANDLLHRLYTTEYPRPRVAAFAKIVDDAAQQGDRVATDLLHQAAEELVRIAKAVTGQLFAPPEQPRLAYVGGVFRSRILLDRFRISLSDPFRAKVSPAIYGPAAGALIEAYRAAGSSPALSQVPEIEK